MIEVVPEVFFLAETSLNDEDVAAWLNEIGGESARKCEITMTGTSIERLVELGARRCYKSFAAGLNPNVTKVRTNSRDYHKNILSQKHGSVMAHGHVTFAFENVSRVFTHEVVRNSVGNDFSQESLRYVRLDDLKFWIPAIIARESEVRLVPAPPDNVEVFGSGCKRNMNPAQIFREVIALSEWAQKALAVYYDIENIPDFERKKLLTSAFRRVAPEGLATGIVVTFNMRSLRWIIEQRTSRFAEEEMRFVFNIVAESALKMWPYLFQDFEKVSTDDGLYEFVPGNSKV